MTVRAPWLAMVALLLLPACATSGSAPADEAATTSVEADDDYLPFDEPPTVDRVVEPDYPEYARRNQIEGRVQLEVTVTEKGKVESARVVESTDRMFEEPALKAVRQWHFKPARKDGEKVRARVTVPVLFRL